MPELDFFLFMMWEHIFFSVMNCIFTADFIPTTDIFPIFPNFGNSGILSKFPESSLYELPEFSGGKFPDLRPLVKRHLTIKKRAERKRDNFLIFCKFLNRNITPPTNQDSSSWSPAAGPRRETFSHIIPWLVPPCVIQGLCSSCQPDGRGPQSPVGRSRVSPPPLTPGTCWKNRTG